MNGIGFEEQTEAAEVIKCGALFRFGFVGRIAHKRNRRHMQEVAAQNSYSSPFSIGRSTPKDVRFCFLSRADHPRGQLFLATLLDAGFRPRLVVEEASELANFGRRAQLEQLEKVSEFEPLAPTRLTCVRYGIPYHTVCDHNDPEVAGLLTSANLDLGIIGDARILERKIIGTTRHGIINTHPGLLPQVRGNMPQIWAIIHGLPQGATVHLINDRADRGPIFKARSIAGAESLSFPRLMFEINRACANLLLDVMQEIVADKAVITTQAHDDRLTFRAASPEIRQIAIDIQNRRATVASAD